MRKFLFFALLLLSVVSFSQAPQFLNYQAIARNGAGTIVTTPIGVKFEILQGSAGGTLVYEETHNITPSSAGVFTAAIGNGSPLVGTFSTINWANGPYFIRVGIDPTGGTVYSTVGTSQLLSVPYALYAETAGNTQTVSISGPNVTGTYPNFTITPGGALTPSTGISIVSGTITNTAPDQTVTISGATGTYPNFTVTSTPPTTITPGNSNISVTGSDPNFTISSVPTLSLSGAQLSISNGNTVTLPTGTTYTNGAGITLSSGTIITNAAPDQIVSIANGTNVTVNSAYPNFTINATPTLSLAASVLSISGGNSVTLPVSPATTVTAGSNVVVSGTAPTYTVSSPTYSLNMSSSVTGVLTNGISSSPFAMFQPTITLSGSSNNVLSVGSNSVTIATYSAGNGLVLGGTFPNFSLSTTSTGTNTAWSTLGNTGTNPSANFLGTTDAQDLVFRTSNSQRMRLFSASGNVGIGNVSSATELLQVETGSNTAMSIISGTNSTLYFGNAGNHFLGAVRYDNINSTMSFWTNNTADRIFIDGSGRVGIGVNVLASELDVNGSLRLNGSRLFLGAVGGINSGYTGIYETSGDLRLAVFSTGAPANPPFASGGNSRDVMTLQNNSGYVGLGTTNPAQNLHIEGVNALIRVQSTQSTTAANSLIEFGNTISSSFNSKGRIGNPGTGDHMEYDALTFHRFTNAGVERMRLTNAGELIIGNFTPFSQLDVSGKITMRTGAIAGYIPVSDGNGTMTWTNPSSITPALWSVSGNSLYTSTLANFVGLGNTSPTAKLHLSGTNSSTFTSSFSASPETAIRIHNDDLTNNNFSSLIFSSLTSGFANFEAAKILGITTNHTTGSVTGDLVFMTRSPANILERVRITSTGNVGIGTTAPASMLHVNGPVTITDGTQGAGRVLTSNAAGTGTWKVNQVAFFCGGSPAATTQTFNASSTSTLVFSSGASSLAYNVGGGYAVATGVFTAPVAGVYHFDAMIVTVGATIGFVTFKMRHSSGNILCEQDGFYNGIAQNWYSAHLGSTVHLNAGERVAIEYYSGTGGTSQFNQDKSSFSGHLVYAD